MEIHKKPLIYIYMKKTISIKTEYEKFVGQRIDKFLSKECPDFSREFLKREIKQGNILVDNKKISPSYKIKNRDEIFIDIEEKIRNEEVKPNPDVNFDIKFESEDFIVIEKSAGLVVHPSGFENEKTLASGLLSKFPEIKNVGEDRIRPGIVHRLDKETSGLMVIALNQRSFEFFKDSFKNKKIEKKYLALVWGKLKNKKGKISGYIGRSKSNGQRQSFSDDCEKVINAKESLSYYEVIEKFEDKSLVEIVPKTGRMHQIRVHMHSIGHPIVGDKKYQTKLIRDKNKYFERHLLHAFSLKFRGLDGKKYQFESDLPKDFSAT